MQWQLTAHWAPNGSNNMTYTQTRNLAPIFVNTVTAGPMTLLFDKTAIFIATRHIASRKCCAPGLLILPLTQCQGRTWKNNMNV